MPKLPITVIMLTFNEAFHLPAAIDNIKEWAEEIFIVDSLSIDRTVDIALEKGVKIVQRPFTNFGDQWNFALNKLPIKTPWAMKMDPDERLSNELKCQIEKAIQAHDPADGYYFPRRLWFMGKPLHVQTDVLRLWRTGKCRFSDVIVNEHPLIEGKLNRLPGVLEHFDSQNLHHWMEKQNRYTTMRAIEIAKDQNLSAKPKLFGTTLERRMFYIKIFFYIPFRYQLQWLHELFIRGAWKDGKTGVTWTRIRIEIRRLCELKFREMRITGRVPAIPQATKGKFDQRIINSPLQKIVSQQVDKI